MSELIPPVIITDIKNITSFEINQIQVKLNTSAEVYVYLKAGDNIVASEMILIDGDDYKIWGNDDNFILEFIKVYIRNKYS